MYVTGEVEPSAVGDLAKKDKLTDTTVSGPHITERVNSWETSLDCGGHGADHDGHGPFGGGDCGVGHRGHGSCNTDHGP